METGWIKPFEVDRMLPPEERDAALPPQRQPGIEPQQYMSLIRLNSTFAEFIDRRFRLRGMAKTTVGTIGIVFLIGAGIPFVGYLIPHTYITDGFGIIAFTIFMVTGSAVTFGGAVMCYYAWPRHDLFTYTHYPIRFNRKTRKVHVFRHNGPGGVLTVPWDEVFFHIGRGRRQKFLCDIRGHVMDGRTVRDTFAVGHYFDDSQLETIQSMWELIRRYMDEGPEAAAEHPLDRLIELSVTPSWTNCYIWVVASAGGLMHSLRFVLFPIVYPIYGLLTSMRWLTFKTCKTPQWPPEIQAECSIEPNDPNIWQEPSYIGEFANRDDVQAHIKKREQKHRNDI